MQAANGRSRKTIQETGAIILMKTGSASASTTAVQVGRYGQILDIFWRQSQLNLGADWMCAMKEREEARRFLTQTVGRLELPLLRFLWEACSVHPMVSLS